MKMEHVKLITDAHVSVFHLTVGADLLLLLLFFILWSI